MVKILSFTNFVLGSLIVALVFLTSTTYTQLFIATILYIPLTYFAVRLFSQDIRIHPQAKIAPIIPKQDPIPKSDNTPARGVDIVDIDKRAFLKLIGATGFSFFFLSLFTKRAESVFLDKLLNNRLLSTDSKSTTQNQPPEDLISKGYTIAEIDEGESIYCGYISKSGGWYILKQDDETGSFRYAKGDSGFPENWIKHTNLQYDYYHKIFS